MAITQRELDYIYSDRRQHRRIYANVLEERIEEDGRTIAAIAKSAGINKGDITSMLAYGSGPVWKIERLRLALNPRLNRVTIYKELTPGEMKCMELKRELHEAEIEAGRAVDEEFSEKSDTKYNDLLTKEQKRDCDIYEKVADLCIEYSLTEVADALNEIESSYVMYLEQVCSFALTDVMNEMSKGDVSD